jgi:hypothetical protein
LLLEQYIAADDVVEDTLKLTTVAVMVFIEVEGSPLGLGVAHGNLL